MRENYPDYKVPVGWSPPSRKIKFEGIDVATCTCRQVVRDNYDVAPIIDAAVTATIDVSGTNYFHVFLTPAQMELLTEGKRYFWVAEVDAPANTPPLKDGKVVILTMLPPQMV